MPFLGSVRLDPAVREGGDDGRPIVLDEGGEAAEAFTEITQRVANNVGIVRRRQVANAAEAAAAADAAKAEGTAPNSPEIGDDAAE